jgi:iron(III) transport system substrate-binding protein
MVLAYNSEAISKTESPKSFKELTHSKWKGKISSGSPLASGTSFTTVAFLAKSYGWEYFKSLRANDLIAEGGNSGVIRRLQSKERPIGIVLLENILRLVATDKRIQFVVPTDGAILQQNVLAIVKKDQSQELVQQVADWFFGPNGQKAMAKSFMYPAVPGYDGPVGAPPFAEILKTAQPWTPEFLSETTKNREKLKEEFSKYIF